jgi:hypothetical protein
MVGRCCVCMSVAPSHGDKGVGKEKNEQEPGMLVLVCPRRRFRVSAWSLTPLLTVVAGLDDTNGAFPGLPASAARESRRDSPIWRNETCASSLGERGLAVLVRSRVPLFM